MSQTIKQQAIVPYTAKQMFDLINDVAAYPEFLPWCAAVDVLAATPTSIQARVHFAHKGIKQRFTTANTLVQDTEIEMNLVEGPFSSLTGRWQFQELGGGCKVQFTLDFAIKNKLFAYAFAKVFTKVANTMVAAFTERAAVLYAAPSITTGESEA